MERITLNTLFNPFKLPNPPWNATQWMYQGFIEQDTQNPSVWNWIADDPGNVPREVLRRRGELFATFWYQGLVKSRAGIYLRVYIVGNFRYLQSGTALSPVRFERDFILNHNFKTIEHSSPYDTVLGDFTDQNEVTYYLNKILALIKTNYENE